MPDINALLIGESWQTISFHVKGFDLFSNAEYTEAGDYLQAALETNGIDTTYQPCHVAASEFPESREALDSYDVVIRVQHDRDPARNVQRWDPQAEQAQATGRIRA